MEAEQTEQDRLRAIEATRAMNELADNFERSVGSVVDTVSSASTELQSSAQAMSSTAEHADKSLPTLPAHLNKRQLM